MKVLILSHKFYPDIGGIESNSEVLANEFTRLGCSVRLVTWTKKNGEKAFPFDIVRNPTLIDLYRAHHWADIVFENNPCLRLAWVNLFIWRPLVVALNTRISRDSGQIGWQDRLKFNWLNRAVDVIAVSEALRKKNWPRAKVIGNPYRKNNFKILPGLIRSIDLVFLGRLVPDKGANLAIAALASLISDESSQSFHSCRLTIIGDGPERGPLEKLTEMLEVSERVTFTGNLQGKELANCLNLHRIILVPSTCEEAFGNVVLEGMACGCIPIVSDKGGLPEAVGNAGLVFESGNVKSLTACIRSLQLGSNAEKQLQINARAHLLKHQPEKVAKAYLKIIRKAHEGKKTTHLKNPYLIP